MRLLKNEIKRDFLKTEYIPAIFSDLKKAFDTIDFNILRVSTRFMTNRFQYVKF